ncbi:MAG: hypothetical protein KDH96_01520 [Candidatus Riesia sp.]|nr:hypothetical protein [Candidatus Riesia sp.]
MLLQEILNNLNTNTSSIVERNFTKNANIQGHNIKVNIFIEQESDIAFVEFFVNETQTIQHDTPIQTTIKILQFVISCMNDYVNTYPNITFCFGADREHEKMYDTLLPRLSTRYNMYFKKSSINLPRSLKAKEWLKAKIQKNHVALVCLYYIYPKISSTRRRNNVTSEHNSQQTHTAQ